ncbi:MAG TPA: MFS transporter [Actinoplanes sp.]|nr:MFS transporter [Actinoplanes sp.]
MTTDLPTTSVRHLLRGHFGWFLTGRTVDMFGSSMTTVALSLAVLQASGRAVDLGIVLAATMVPMLVLMLAGGVLADRMSRRLLLIAANTVSAAAIGAVAILLLTGGYRLPLIAVLSLVSGAAGAFASPALRGIVPELVADADLPRANALLAGSGHAVRIIAPTVAGLLTATAGGGWALVVDAGSYLLAALFFLRLPGGSRLPASAPGIGRELLDGWRVFRSMHWVVLTSVSFAVINAVNVGPWNILGPMLVTGQSGPLGWGAVLSVRAAGLLLMSVVAVRLVLSNPLRTGRLFGVLSALPLLALGFTGEPWIVAAAAFIGGLGFTVSAVTWDTALQTRVPREALSRVSAFDDLFSYLAIPLSQLATGPLAATFGAGRVALLCGVTYLVAALVPLFSSQVRRG